MAIGRWLPLVFRALVVWQLAWPALSKFALYGVRVEHFRHDYGIPFPAVLVPVVGAFEVAMVVAALLGVAGRLVAIPTSVIMLVAFAADGPNEGSVLVLAGCLGILLLGTGPLSLWAPEERWWRGVQDVGRRDGAGGYGRHPRGGLG